MESDTITVYGCKRRATIEYAFDSNKTVNEVLIDIGKILQRSYFSIALIINGIYCVHEKQIQHYQNKYPQSIFYVCLKTWSPADLVYNFRCIQLMKDPSFVPNQECCVCLDNKPGIANQECYHDSILCIECCQKLDKCPFCFSKIKNVQKLLQ